MTSVEDKKTANEPEKDQADVEQERPSKKVKADGAEEKSQEPAPEQPKTEEKKIFGAGFTSKSPWAAASSPFSSLASATAPTNVFGQGATTVTFGSLLGSNGSGTPNVFASNKGEDEKTEGEKKEGLTSEALAPPASWVSPFSTSSIFGAKSQKSEEKAEKVSEAPASGEENETTDFQTRGKLYVFDSETKKDWRERGVGVFKLNTPLKGGTSRLVMRSDGNMRLVLNVNLYDGMVVELASEKAVRFVTMDSEINKMRTYLLRTRTKDDAKNLIKEIKTKVKITERELPPQTLPSLSQSQSQSESQEKKTGEEKEEEEKQEKSKEDSKSAEEGEGDKDQNASSSEGEEDNDEDEE